MKWLFFILLALPGYAQKPYLRFINITTADGLSANRVNAIVQDARGFMWLGSESGLNCYDGYEFTHYRTGDAGLTNDRIRVLHLDPMGDLWVGTEGGLFRFHHASGHFRHYPLMPEGEQDFWATINAIVQDDTRKLWVATKSGLVRFDPDHPEILTHFSVASGHFAWREVNTVLVDRQQRVWVANKGILFHYDQASNSFENVTVPGNSRIQELFEDRKGRLWVGTEQGLNVLDLASHTELRRYQSPDSKHFPRNVEAIYQDSAGHIWTGTYFTGLGMMEEPLQEAFYHYREHPAHVDGLASNNIISIFEDRTGNLWLGTAGSGVLVYSLDNLQFRHYRHDSSEPGSLSNDNVWNIYEDNQDRLWIATDHGLNLWDTETGRFQLYSIDPKRQDASIVNRVRTVMQDTEGQFWVGNRLGLYRFNPQTGSFSPWELVPDKKVQVRAILEDSSQTLWVGSSTHGLFYRTRGEESFRRIEVGSEYLMDDSARALLEDRSEWLWVGHNQGLTLISPDRTNFVWHAHDPADTRTISGASVNALYQDFKGRVWAGTGNGLSRLIREEKEGRVQVRATRFTETAGLPSAHVYGIQEDERGRLWLSTALGLAVFNTDTLRFRGYRQYHGLQSDDFNTGASCRTRDGRLIFGGPSGFNVIHPESIDRERPPPSLQLTELRLANEVISLEHPNGVLRQPIYMTDALTLDYTQNVFSVQFAAMSFVNTSELRYAYLLEGFDKKWVYTAGDWRRATYTNLDPKTYTLRVKAGSEGRWYPEETTLQIQVKPAPWETPLAKAGYVLGGLFILGLIWYTERSRLQREKEYSQALEEKNDEILRTQSQVVMQEKMASIGLLTAGIAHEIKNPTTFTRLSAQNLDEELRDLKSWLEGLIADDATPEFREALDERMEDILEHVHMINDGTQRIVTLSQDLHSFSRADRGIHDVNLTDQISSTLKLVQAKFKDKVEFQTRFHDPLPMKCRPAQLNQVFMNLIVNACQELVRKIGDNRGQRGRLTIETETDHDVGVVRFIDTGDGMTEEVKKQIFEPFFTTKEPGEGTGLGLSITARIIRDHGGRIEVDSKPGQGTTFTLLLPRDGVPG